ncbi:MAG TPA: ABC transporter ATP-binding protein [Polyangiaceae bacterium]|nr:ABC transporter ATP-binding protein [Polyangiaceae bacterium]
MTDAPTDVVLRATGLAKTYRKPFTRKRVDAVHGVGFEVGRGEIFGFLGPNGAGKTTSIKMVTGLIAPTAGTVEILGQRGPAPEVMRRVGFLPESPYVYPYLTPREFVSLCGTLSGLSGADLAKKVVAVIERVGIGQAIDRPARALSKGMLQRAALAAALVHEPELLILDEPMSGLDPVGRKEVRDLIVEEKQRGHTVFFSSHILSDVELLCDRVCILRQGRVVVAGTLRELLVQKKRRSEVTIAGASDALRSQLAPVAATLREAGGTLVLEVEGDDAVRSVVERVLAEGARLESVTPKRETLEDLFVREAL